jgi:hypothetical protein
LTGSKPWLILTTHNTLEYLWVQLDQNQAAKTRKHHWQKPK